MNQAWIDFGSVAGTSGTDAFVLKVGDNVEDLFDLKDGLVLGTNIDTEKAADYEGNLWRENK